MSAPIPFAELPLSNSNVLLTATPAHQMQNVTFSSAAERVIQVWELHNKIRQNLSIVDAKNFPLAKSYPGHVPYWKGKLKHRHLGVLACSQTSVV